MRYLLDTTLLIDHAKGRPGVAELVESLFDEPNDLYTCDVVVVESLSGGPPEELGSIRSMLRVLEYVAASPETAEWAATSHRDRQAGPRSLGDALIAAIAHSLGAAVITRNPGDFEWQGVPVLAYD
jgi:predicted nucleic acid-binding protein